MTGVQTCALPISNCCLDLGLVGESPRWWYLFGPSHPTEELLVTNVGTATLTGLHLSGDPGSPPFVLDVDSCSFVDLGPGGSCMVNVTFSPRAGCSPGESYGKEWPFITSPSLSFPLHLNVLGSCPLP